MARGNTKIVINSITYDNCSNNILKGVRKDDETDDSRNVEVVVDNSDKRFTNLNLRGLSAVLSYDYGAGYVASSPLTVIYQDDITSGGNYQTVLTLSGSQNMISEDKASKDYVHDATDTKTVEALLTEVLSGVAVPSEVTATQATMGSYYALYGGGQIMTGQIMYIPKRTVKSIQFYLKKVGSPVGNVYFFMKPVDFSWTEYKVALDASALSTSPAWITATLDTAKYVDDEVYIYCEFQGGDEDNYVAIGYSSSAILSDENLIRGYATGDWIPERAQDCGYKYTYDIAGIDCFAHTPAYTVTIDSRDSLINVYTPGADFKISEGDSREDVVNRLLDYTACYKKIENDGEVHFFTKPTSGNSYTSVKGDFYSHTNRKGLVIPNKIVVKSYDFETDAVEGSATSAASYALKPITGAPVRMYVVDATQAAAVAAAIISRLEVNSQVGSSLVPMDNFEQMFNYVTITNTWNGSTTTGNIAFISRYSMGGLFQQFISFGRQSKRGIGGSAPKRQVRLEGVYGAEEVVKWGQLIGEDRSLSIIAENTEDIYEKLNLIHLILADLGVDVDKIEREGSSSEWVYNAIKDITSIYFGHLYAGGDNVVIDALGLTINAPSSGAGYSKWTYQASNRGSIEGDTTEWALFGATNIDVRLFSQGTGGLALRAGSTPTSPPDDTLILEADAGIQIIAASGSTTDITRLKTTQTVVTGSRALNDTGTPHIYQNTNGCPILVTVSITWTGTAGITVLTDSSTPPTTVVAQEYYDGTDWVGVCVSFIVLNNNYYKVHTTSAGDTTLTYWTEWKIGL